MSILGGVGASAAAGEILQFIEKLKRDHASKPEVLNVLGQIGRKAEEIKELGDKGWY